jgi:uncharacterized membrane protein YbhN (UPF0104 family)
MFANWGLEARKWQLSLAELEHMSFQKSFRAVFTGTTIASFTPNRIGDYLGRMLYVSEGKRVQSIPLTILCSMAQMLVTIVTGIAGVFYLQKYLHTQMIEDHQSMQLGLDILSYLTALLVLIIAFFYFRLSAMVRFLENRGWGKYLAPMKVLKELKLTILFHLLSLSFVRYVVFILQYYLLFSLFGVSLTWIQTFAGISTMFLVMVFVPTFTFLTDLGLRWESSIQIIRLFSPNTTGIFAVSLGIWMINLIIPALIGSLLILRIKLFRGK